MRKYFYTLIAALVLITSCKTEEKKEVKNYQKLADSELIRMPSPLMLDFSDRPKWNYCHGLELQSFLQVWEKTGDQKYFDYAYAYVDTMVREDGSILTYKATEYNIDRLNSGKILFTMYEKTGEPRFKQAMDTLRDQMRTHPRTTFGSYWHKKVYPHQVWLDGLYMAGPFLAQYAKVFNEPELFDDVANQIIDVRKVMYDEKTGLYYHGWDESKEQRWANPETGQSPNFWSRSIGWYMMSMVDVLDFLPTDHPKRGEILTILQELSAAVENFRDPESGMWYQVTDQIGREGNYEEATGSVMFIYTWIKGAQKGYLDKSFEAKGIEAYDQYVKRFVKQNEDGTTSITNCCAVSGLGGDPKYRDGSFEYYISEPVRDNDPKAIAPFIMLSIMLDK